MLLKKFKYFFILILFGTCQSLLAAPPFINDDAAPADLKELDLYLYTNFNIIPQNSFILGPVLEIDYGILKNTEFQITIPWATFLSNTTASGSATGLGDIQANIKYRFLDESMYFPAMAIEPTIVFPSGDANRSLGNGRMWYEFPLWLEKHWGSITTYGGGGYVYNPAPGVDNFFFGGLVITKNVTDKLLVGGEIYSQGASGRLALAPFQDIDPFTLINLGATYNFNTNFAFLASCGHSLSGVPQWVGYIGLNWTFNNPQSKQ